MLKEVVHSGKLCNTTAPHPPPIHPASAPKPDGPTQWLSISQHGRGIRGFDSGADGDFSHFNEIASLHIKISLFIDMFL